MSTTLAKLKRNTETTEAALIAALIPNQWGYAQDTRRICTMEPDGVTVRYFFDSVTLADQTFVSGSTWIGAYGISGVTPTSGGGAGAGGTLQGMLEGLANYSAAAATAVVLAPSLATRNVIQASADVLPLTVKAYAAGTANLTEWQKSDGTVYAYIDQYGSFANSISNPGGFQSLTVQNLDNTSLSSHALVSINVGGASAGDPYIYFHISGGSNDWAMGVDNSASDAFTISKFAGLGTNNYLTISTAGLVTVPGTFAVTGTTTLSSTMGIAGTASYTGSAGAAFNSGANGYYYSQIAGNNQIALNSAGVFGFISNPSINLWALGYGATPTTLGTSALTWNNSGAVTIPGTLGVTGAATLASSLEFTTAASGGAGKLWKSSGSGLVMEGVAGSSYDLTFLNPSAQSIMRVPTGTQSLEITNTLSVLGAATMAGITSSGDLTVSRASIAGTVGLVVTNSDNTSGTSHSLIRASVGGSSGGDPYFVSQISGGQNWAWGLDNSDADAFVITPASTLGGATNGLRISTAGAVTMPGTLGVTGALTGSSGTFSGRLNVLGATDTSGYSVNALSGNIATAGAGSIVSYGVGTPSASNTEFMSLTHNGVTGATLTVDKLGTGTYRGFTLFVNNTAAITVNTSAGITLSGDVSVTNTFGVTGDTTLSTKLGIGNAPTYDLHIKKSVTTGITAFVENANNGNVLADALIGCKVGGASAGDPYAAFIIGSAAAYLGLDNSDSDKFKISLGFAGLGTGDALVITPGTLAVSILGSTTLAGGLTSSVGGGYEEGSFTVTLTGCTTSPTATAKFVKVGKRITILLPAVSATSNAITCSLTGLSASLQPTTWQKVNISEVFNNGAVCDSSSGLAARVGPSGTIELWFFCNLTGWTSAGTKGINSPVSFTYTLD